MTKQFLLNFLIIVVFIFSILFLLYENMKGYSEKEQHIRIRLPQNNYKKCNNDKIKTRHQFRDHGML